jgi:hypothetical protein
MQRVLSSRYQISGRAIIAPAAPESHPRGGSLSTLPLSARLSGVLLPVQIDSQLVGRGPQVVA